MYTVFVKKSKFELLFSLVLIFFLIGCKESDTEKNGPISSKTQSKFKDIKTGESYVLNPNRKSLGENENTRSLISTIADGSGQVEVRIWEATSDVGNAPTVAVNVDQGYVLVGGGARVLSSDGSSVPWAVLTESRPANDGTFSTWLAGSKDHYYHYAHKLQVYVIGLKLSGVSSSTLISNMSLNENTSGSYNHPNTSVSVPSGYKLVGGGAKVNWNGYGNLLVTSEPDASLSTWSVQSKDHYALSPSTITAYAIGLKSTINGFGNLLFSLATATNASNSSSWLTVTTNVDQDKVPTCIGANSFSSQTLTAGRLLYEMYPQANIRSITASSKDHYYPDQTNASVSVKAIQIRKQ